VFIDTMTFIGRMPCFAWQLPHVLHRFGSIPDHRRQHLVVQSLQVHVLLESISASPIEAHSAFTILSVCGPCPLVCSAITVTAVGVERSMYLPHFGLLLSVALGKPTQEV
jgi:hypothetical protein